MSHNLKSDVNVDKLLVNGYDLTNLKLSNITIQKAFIQELYPFSSNRTSILQDFSKEEAKNSRTKFFKFPIAPKAKKIHVKIINDIHPCGKFHGFGLFLIIAAVHFVMNTLR